MLLESIVLGAVGGVVGFAGNQLYKKIKPVKNEDMFLSEFEKEIRANEIEEETWKEIWKHNYVKVVDEDKASYPELLGSYYLNNGISVSIYPEGTRTKDENYMTGEYKAGALKPAYETKKDMVVIGIDGSYKVFSKKYKKNLKINVKVLDILKFGEYGSKNTTDLAKEIQDKTNQYLVEVRKQ